MKGLLKNDTGPSASSRRAVDVTMLGAGAIQLRGSPLFAEAGGVPCRKFVERVFSNPAVRCVEICPRETTAAIYFDQDTPGLRPLLKQVAEALTTDTSAEHAGGSVEHLFLRRDDVVRVSRHGDVVTTWQVLHEIPGRIRLRHDALTRRTKTARYVEDELQATYGVLSAKVKPLTGTVLVTFHPEALRTSQLLRIMEGILHDAHASAPRGYLHPAGKTALVHASLGLAAVADFAVPGLMPASAALLVLSNVDTFRSAWKELSRRQLGTAVLYTTIVGVTVATGFFFTAALMSWFLNFWDQRYHRQLSDVQRRLLADFRRRARFVWISRGDVDLEVPIEKVRPGNVVSLQTGDLVPVDGYVIKGQAQVDERLVMGVRGLSTKTKGDRVYASSLLFDGRLKVKVTRVGDRTRAAAIGSMIEKASTPPPAPLKVRGDSFARYTVLPTMATAGAGLLVGDLGTALAILRADYATGPGMTTPLGTLQDLHRAASAGVIVRDAAVFEKLRDVDLLLFDLPANADTSSGAWLHANGNGQHSNGSGGRHRKHSGGVQTGVLSESPGSEVRELAARLGADFYHGGLQLGDRADLIRYYGQQGKRVAYVGDCRQYPQAAELAHVAVSLADVVHAGHDPADAFLVGQELKNVQLLWDISRTRQGRQRVHASWTLLPNLLCVAGALTLGFTSMYTVLITNIGVLTVYRSGTRWLRRGQCGGFHDRQLRQDVYNEANHAEVKP